MDKIYERGLLYDFYSELLTEHQRKIYSGVVIDDMSLGELSEEEGISRQGIYDLIKRCDKTLEAYENKLHLIERFKHIRNTVSEIDSFISEESALDGKAKLMLKCKLEEIIEEL